MLNFLQLAAVYGVVLDDDRLVHLADTEGKKIGLLPLGLAILADDLGNFELCHNLSLFIR